MTVTAEELREIQHASPFRPYTIRMADGRSFQVPHPDFVWIAPRGRTLVVAQPRPGEDLADDPMSILDMMLVTEIQLDPVV